MSVLKLAEFVNFPVPTSPTLVALALGFAGLFVLAVIIDSRRRQGLHKLRKLSEWKAVADIVAARDISTDEAELLDQVVRKHHPNHPLKAITLRHDFEACVEAEMSQLKKSGDKKAFEERGAGLRDLRCQLGLDYIPIGQRISSSRDLGSGQWMSVSRAEEGNQPWFRMMVETVDEAYLYVSRHGKDAAPTFREGETIRCRLWRDEDARYIFTTKVVVFDDPPPAWRLEHVSDMQRVQTRAHFRVRHDQTTMVGLINAPVDGDLSNIGKRRIVTKFRGRITSLSAGGCALVLQQSVSKQILLRIGIELPREDPIEVEAEVVAVSAISGGRHLIRTHFVAVDDARRDKVAKYVLLRQQHMIQAEGDR